MHRAARVSPSEAVILTEYNLGENAPDSTRVCTKNFGRADTTEKASSETWNQFSGFFFDKRVNHHTTVVLIVRYEHGWHDVCSSLYQ